MGPLSVLDLAFQSKVAASTIQNWLAGKANGAPWEAEIDKLEKVAIVLKCTVEDLIFTASELSRHVCVESVDMFDKELTPDVMHHIRFDGDWSFRFQLDYDLNIDGELPSERKWDFEIDAKLHQRGMYVKLEQIGIVEDRPFRWQFKGQIIESGYLAGTYSLKSHARTEWGMVLIYYQAEKLFGTFTSRNAKHGALPIGGRFTATRKKRQSPNSNQQEQWSTSGS
jgi:transcriptional regulator with XRE-family HTH domain